METMRRIRLALLLIGGVIAAGTTGYLLLGFSFLEALFQTVITISTVGYREVQPLDAVGQVYTIVLILAGVGTALYTFTLVLEAVIGGHLRQHLEGRRMTRDIGSMSGHVLVCGAGRVGRSCAAYLRATGHEVVLLDRDAERLADLGYPYVLGDVTDDDVLRAGGIEKAHALIAALDTDSSNVYVVLSSRALRSDLIIVARARDEGSKSKLLRAGANRAVNPQLIGGRRMAAFAEQRHVAEFLDDVMHDESLDYRMEQLEITGGSALAGRTLADAAILENTGVQLLSIRTSADGKFLTDPPPSTVLEPGAFLIVVGTSGQLAALRKLG